MKSSGVRQLTDETLASELCITAATAIRSFHTRSQVKWAYQKQYPQITLRAGEVGLETNSARKCQCTALTTPMIELKRCAEALDAII